MPGEMSGVFFLFTFFTESDGVMAENSDVTPVEEQVGKLGEAIAHKADKLKYILLAVLVILIAAAAIVSYSRKSAARRDAAAKDKVYETIAKIQNEQTPVAEGASVFAQAAKEYSGTTAGAQASLLQFAYSYNENKDYAAAEKAADQFVKTYPKNKMVSRARYAQGQAMLQQDKVDEAIAVFRSLAASNEPEILPEAKLALAQALELRAEQAKDDPDEYRTRLMAAEAEYTDIISRSLNSVPSQRGFWPQAVTMPADYALVQLKDKLAGHVHKAPLGKEPAPAQPAGGVMTIPPPPAEGGTASASEGEEISTPADAAATAAVEEADEAARPVAEAVSEPEAGDAAAEAVAESNAAADEAASAVESASEAATEVAEEAAAGQPASGEDGEGSESAPEENAAETKAEE